MSSVVAPAEKDKTVVVPELTAATVEGYDPTLEYTEEEEARVRRLIDTRFMPWILFSTFVLNMDRTNIANAISGGLPRSLRFTITVINNAGSMYAALFSLAAFFGSILAKRFGPHRVIPVRIIQCGSGKSGLSSIERLNDGL